MNWQTWAVVERLTWYTLVCYLEHFPSLIFRSVCLSTHSISGRQDWKCWCFGRIDSRMFKFPQLKFSWCSCTRWFNVLGEHESGGKFDLAGFDAEWV